MTIFTYDVTQDERYKKYTDLLVPGNTPAPSPSKSQAGDTEAG